MPAQVAPGGLVAARHLWFVATRLLIGACGLAALPFCLAVHGHVTPALALVLVGFAAQAALAMLIGRGVGLTRLHQISVVSLSLCVSLAYAIAPDWAWPLLGLCLALMIEAIMLAGAAGLGLTAVCAMAVFGTLLSLDAVMAAKMSSAPRLAFLFVSGFGLIAATFSSCRFALSALQELEARENSLKRHARALPETLGDLVLKLDGMGAVVAASQSGGALAGMPISDLLGRALFDRVHVADKPLFLMTISDALHSRETCVARLRLRADQPWPSSAGQDAGISPRDANGAKEHAGYVWLDMRARAVPADGNEPPTDILCVMRDVSAEVGQSEALEALRRETDEAVRSRTRVMATVSHELRTPLGAVMGFAEILASESLAPDDEAKRRDYARVIQGQAGHLLQIVDTLLDIAKIEAGSYEIQREECRVDTVVAAAIDMVKYRADKGAVAINVEIEPALPDLRADRRSILQILVNLLGNAVKFTPPGGKVTLSARREDGSLAIAVTDSGIGIAPEHLSRLGEPFFRAGRRADEADGAGLGLAVVRGLLDLHGGFLTLDSRVGHGSRATIRLAFDARPRLTPSRPALPADRPKPARSIVPPVIAVKKIA